MDLRELSTRVQREQGLLKDTIPGKRSSRHVTGKETPFEATLEKARRDLGNAPDGIRLSAHAVQRLNQREIPLTPQDQRDLADAVDVLKEKGARDALIIRQDAAFVVNVPNRTLVTAISQAELQQRIFTQIDSTMLL